jgi:hypothetical protein
MATFAFVVCNDCGMTPQVLHNDSRGCQHWYGGAAALQHHKETLVQWPFGSNFKVHTHSTSLHLDDNTISRFNLLGQHGLVCRNFPHAPGTLHQVLVTTQCNLAAAVCAAVSSSQTKEEIATDVKQELSKVMGTFGFEILQALVTDIDPAPRVKDAMNEINAAQRLRWGVLQGLLQPPSLQIAI